MGNNEGISLMAFWTNIALFRALDRYYRGAPPPGFFYLAFVTDTPAPTAQTQTLSELTEIAAGNGYSSGGIPLTIAPFPTFIQEAAASSAELKDIVVGAVGGPIPSSGSGARYAVLTNDNATIADREVYFVWDMASERVIADGGTLVMSDAMLRFRQWSTPPSSPPFVTNRGLYLMLSHFLRNTPEPSQFYLALLNDNVVPTYQSNLLGDNDWEIEEGNGYVEGGIAIPRSIAGFSSVGLSQEGGYAAVTLADVDFIASGGTIGPAYRCALLTDEPTPANRNILAVWDFDGAYSVNSGETLRLRNLRIYARQFS